MDVDLPTVLSPELISAETLDALATSVDQQIKSIEALVRQSGHDARTFSQSLEAGAAKLADPARSAKAIGDLVGLTREMVEKTRLVETQLRNRTAEMALLNAGLTEARKEAWNRHSNLRNRREFERALGSCVERARIHGTPVSVAMCDIDNFTSVNDAHGPEAGDRVIGFIGTLIDQAMDHQAMVCRSLGAEFLILFDGMPARQACELTEHARQMLVERNIVDRQSGRRIGHMNFSAGVASIAHDFNISLMLARADRALQRAKASSRGSVKIAY